MGYKAMASGWNMRSGWRAAGTATVLAVAGMALAACGGSTPTASTSHTTAPSTTVGTAATSTTTAGSGSAGLSSIISHLTAAENGTFSVTYSVTGTGSPQTVTFAQDPPKSAIIAGSGRAIDTGTTSLFCSTTTCLSMGSSNPLAALEGLFEPSKVLPALQSYEGQEAEHAAGITVTYSNRTVGGQASTCATIHTPTMSSPAVYCVTSTGVLSYAAEGSGVVTLTAYSSSPDPSDFSPPPGTTVQTLPSGVDIPSGVDVP